ncbi:MAG: endoglucanase [Veillonellaceae bacterium]|jgi:mannan endo-1,4-beta-mannosidase|nr:endoglucanase [Veillonellaceae bacterium]
MRLTKLLMTFLAIFLLIITPSIGKANSAYIINGILTESAPETFESDVKQITEFNNWYNRYTNYPSGYSMIYPRDMIVDVSLSAVRTVFANNITKIEVYYDDFSNTETTARNYIHYGNRFLRNTDDHTVTLDSTFSVNGFKTHLLKWERRKLARVENDKNYYASAEIIKNSSEVYTIFIKSSQPIQNELAIIESFKIIDKLGQAGIYKRNARSFSKFNSETVSFYDKYFSPTSKLTWGLFEPSAPETFSYLAPLETAMDYTFPILLRYQSLEENAPIRGLNKAYEQGRYVELTLQTVNPGLVNALRSQSANANARIIYQMLDGQYDDYLHEYAARLKAFGHPVLFRLNNEMNGDWCWYSAYYTSKDTDLYIALWKYIHSIFMAEGVENVLWVWNPHDVSRPDFKWNHYLTYYPGDEYVDIIGLTGYNNGTYFPGEKWREFDEIYQPIYDEYTAIFPKPLMITEFASNSVGGDKAAWLQNMFNSINKYPAIKAAVWWSGIDYDENGNPGRIYLIDESEEYLKIFRENLPE